MTITKSLELSDYAMKRKADHLCYRFKKAGITWDKRYVNQDTNNSYR